ncbi:hypothetical protein [Flavobacterium sp. HNIBRBA15423]|uniref:hypothetical protein n=1 Tax=Flavobacterium sp. HNIBRBA15423 TaxID=3458683 RepID=UPI004044EB68
MILAFGLWGCNNQTKVKTVDKSSVDTLPNVSNVSTDKQKQKIIIKNKSQYDQSFIDGLSEYNEPIKLIENYILVGQDTVYFSEDLQLNKETIFKGTKDKKNFVLSVTRINLTSLNYTFQILNKDSKAISNKSGRATLGSLFFLGSETDDDDDDDDETGDGYLSVEYWDNSADCSFAIRIGEKDDNGKFRAKIKLSCKDDKLKNIGLDDNPTLRTE